ncbi:MAG: hypothetical protein ACKVQR_04300 [Aquabacterium sp.]
MSILNKSNREQLRSQLLTAMLPSRADELKALEHAAFKAVLISYYGAKGLRRIAGLPPHWLNRVDSVLVKRSGQPYWERCHGEPIALPGKLPEASALDERAQAAIDTWLDAVCAYRKDIQTLGARLDQLLNGCRTMAALLERLPEARDLLKLPPAETDDDIAENVRAILRRRGTA